MFIKESSWYIIIACKKFEIFSQILTYTRIELTCKWSLHNKNTCKEYGQYNVKIIDTHTYIYNEKFNEN